MRISSRLMGIYAPVLSSALLLIALAVRMPYLLLVPQATDESYEVLWGLDIALGRHLPLTGVDAYDGPFFAYLLAGLFRVFGLSVWLPRLTVALFGALTVVAAYWLAHVMAGRSAGLVAAALTATCPFLVTYASHMAFSSCLTPFFMTLTVAALYVGVSRDRPWLLALAGLAAALTLQTHPTSAVALVGTVIWFLTRRDSRAWLCRPAPYAALALGGLGYSPVLVAGLRPEGQWLEQAQQRTYALALVGSPVEYLTRVLVLAKNVAYLVGGGLPPNTAVIWVAAAVLGCLAAFGMLLAWRRGNSLLCLVFLSTLLLLPLAVNPGGLRYFLFLVPLAYVGVGGAVAHLVHAIRERTRVRQGRPIYLSVALGSAGLVGLLAAYPLVTIARHYQYVTAAGLTNAEYLRLAHVVREAGACGDGLFVEVRSPAEAEGATPVAAFALHAIHATLTLDQCAHTALPWQEVRQRVAGHDGATWVILAEPSGVHDSPLTTWRRVTSAPVTLADARTVVHVYRVTHWGELDNEVR